MYVAHQVSQDMMAHLDKEGGRDQQDPEENQVHLELVRKGRKVRELQIHRTDSAYVEFSNDDYNFTEMIFFNLQS